jgi:hypothetical protein
LRFRDTQHRARGKGGIQRVSAATQDIQADGRGHRLTRGHHAMSTHHDGSSGKLIVTHEFFFTSAISDRIFTLKRG